MCAVIGTRLSALRAMRLVPQDRQRDGHRRREQPRSLHQGSAGASVLQHHSPARRRARKSKTDERQRRFGQDERRHEQRRLDHRGTRGRRQQVP